MDGRVRIYRGNRASLSARRLGRSLGIPVISTERSTFRVHANDRIINWGASSGSEQTEGGSWINDHAAVDRAARKDVALATITSGVVENTTDRAVAAGWLATDGLIIARDQLRGSRGAGIRVIRRREEGGVEHQLHADRARLWTRYFKGRAEYRLHCTTGRCFDAQHKRRRGGRETPAVNEVRNLQNGWVFCREGCDPPEEAKAKACAAIRDLGLDFGAVDLKWNEHYQRVGILEVNTAPGLEGQTLESYSNMLKELLDEGTSTA